MTVERTLFQVAVGVLHQPRLCPEHHIAVGTLPTLRAVHCDPVSVQVWLTIAHFETDVTLLGHQLFALMNRGHMLLHGRLEGKLHAAVVAQMLELLVRNFGVIFELANGGERLAAVRTGDSLAVAARKKAFKMTDRAQ